MGAGFDALASAGIQNRLGAEDEQRQAQLQNITNAGLSPEQQRDAIQQLYAKDPSALKRHVENLFGRLVGRKPQPVAPAYAPQSVTTQASPLKVGNATLPAPAPVTVSYPGAKTHAERLAQDLSGGKTKEQQALDLFNQEGAAGLASKQRALKWIQSLPADQQHTASELLGISQRPNFKNFRNTKTGETVTWDANDGTPGPDWVLTGSSSSSVRSLGYGISAADAIKAMQATGQKYAKPDGSFYTPQELAALPPNMQLRAFAVGGQVYYGVANQTEHTVTFGNQVYRMDQFGNVDTSAPLGVARVPTTHSSTSTDPFGVKTTTTSTTAPVTPGSATVAPGASVSPANRNTAPAPRKVVSHHAGASRTHAPSAPRVLDASGHIPDGAANPYLVQAANSLLDGMDVEKLTLPQRDRTAAMELAKKYGWKGQGLFTPRESLQLREGANVIQQILNSDALNVLDGGTIANLPMLGQSADPSKAGLWGRLTTSLASKAETPQQQEFMRYWRQLDALAIGLRSLVQTGRATQTQVDRLIAELPNPYNTTSSADARNRLRMVQNELRVAAESGKLSDVPLGGAGQGGGQKVRKFNQATGRLE